MDSEAQAGLPTPQGRQVLSSSGKMPQSPPQLSVRCSRMPEPSGPRDVAFRRRAGQGKSRKLLDPHWDAALLASLACRSGGGPSLER